MTILRYIARLLVGRSRVLRRLRRTRDALRREREETAYLRKALGGAVDALDALTWSRRRAGAEDKFAAEYLREKRP